MTRMEFDTITVTNPNGTISEYTNSYPFLLQSGVFNILKENFSFGDANSDGSGTQNQIFWYPESAKKWFKRQVEQGVSSFLPNFW